MNDSSAVTLSRDDYFRVKEIFVAALKNAANIIVESPEEDVYAMTVDFFALEKRR